MPVYLLATLDTKGVETAFVRDELAALGVPTLVIDTGCQGTPAIEADISREEIYQAAGTTLEAMRRRGDRGIAVTNAAKGAAKIIVGFYGAECVEGLLGLGGSAGTTI